MEAYGWFLTVFFLWLAGTLRLKDSLGDQSQCHARGLPSSARRWRVQPGSERQLQAIADGPGALHEGRLAVRMTSVLGNEFALSTAIHVLGQRNQRTEKLVDRSRMSQMRSIIGTGCSSGSPGRR